MRVGQVPIPRDVQEFHAAELARRFEGAPARQPWEVLLDDVNAISRGALLECAGGAN